MDSEKSIDLPELDEHQRGKQIQPGTVMTGEDPVYEEDPGEIERRWAEARRPDEC